MDNQEPQELDARFGVPGHIRFAAGQGGLTVAEISNAHANAAVALHGGHVLAFQPRGQAPVLWVSRHAVYAPAMPIRGGIPICWPWFGPHPEDASKPAHGFARTRPWRVLETGGAPGGATTIRLGLTDDEATRALWPHPFELELALVVGARLGVTLTARNTGESAFTCGGALHSYFAVGDPAAITIVGLDGRDYLDKVDGGARKRQHGEVTIAGETDRVYLDTEETCTIVDPALGRRIAVVKSGSRTTVVWNPGAEKARRLQDFGDDEYREMVCVETANAGPDTVTLQPGASHRLAALIGLE
jgi:glucose-6-phosphate 1-epimerase